jgi:crossover junction endodeoxyribonuclease RuvC
LSTPIIAHATVQAPPTPIYVGLDLSLTSTGVAIIHNGTATVRRVKSKGVARATTADQAERLARLVTDIAAAFPATDHTKIAVEGPSYGSTGSAAHILGGLWWLVRDYLRGMNVAVVPPGTVKKYATGRGNAGKDEVLATVVRRYADVAVTGNDEADALVLAAIAARLDEHPFEDSLPVAHFSTLQSAVSA